MVTVKKKLCTNKEIDIFRISTYMEIVILRITWQAIKYKKDMLTDIN